MCKRRAWLCFPKVCIYHKQGRGHPGTMDCGLWNPGLKYVNFTPEAKVKSAPWNHIILKWKQRSPEKGVWKMLPGTTNTYKVCSGECLSRSPKWRFKVFKVFGNFFYCDTIYITRNLSFLRVQFSDTKYMHDVAWPSPLSVSRTFSSQTETL